MWFGLNVQAICDSYLVCSYDIVAAPEEVNDLQAFNCCTDLHKLFDTLHNEYFITTNNPYTLLRWIHITFTKPRLRTGR
jgi:hypothetical protein